MAQFANPVYPMTPNFLRAILRHADGTGADLYLEEHGLSDDDLAALEDLGFEPDEEEAVLVLPRELFQEVYDSAHEVGFAPSWTDKDRRAFTQVAAEIREYHQELATAEQQAEDEDYDDDEDEDYGEDDGEDYDDDEGDDEDYGDDDDYEDELEAAPSEYQSAMALSNDREYLRLSEENQRMHSQMQSLVLTTREDVANRVLEDAQNRGVNAGFLNFASSLLGALSEDMSEPILQLSSTGQQLNAFDSVIRLISLAGGTVPTDRRADGGKGVKLSTDGGDTTSAFDQGQTEADKYSQVVKNLISNDLKGITHVDTLLA